jgi:AraC family carnitine catabolism transcriptional activator
MQRLTIIVSGLIYFAMAAASVVFHLVPRFSMISLYGALEPLRVANRFAPDSFDWYFASLDGGPVTASNDIPVTASLKLADVKRPALLAICASYDPEKPARKPVLNAIRRLAAAKVQLAGIDTGPFFLGWAGVLDGYRATCHWESYPGFRESFPGVSCSPSLFEIDRDRMSCAGGSTSIDMMLAWIRGRLGNSVATAVADQLVHSRSPDPMDVQRVAAPDRFGVDDQRLLAAIRLMEQQVEEPCVAQELAAAAGLSQRQFERLFRLKLGERPMALYLRLRLERAGRLLSYSALPVQEVAVATGFASLPQFSRAFRRQFGMPPTAWRSR